MNRRDFLKGAGVSLAAIVGYQNRDEIGDTAGGGLHWVADLLEGGDGQRGEDEPEYPQNDPVDAPEHTDTDNGDQPTEGEEPDFYTLDDVRQAPASFMDGWDKPVAAYVRYIGNQRWEHPSLDDRDGEDSVYETERTYDLYADPDEAVRELDVVDRENGSVYMFIKDREGFFGGSDQDFGLSRGEWYPGTGIGAKQILITDGEMTRRSPHGDGDNEDSNWVVLAEDYEDF